MPETANVFSPAQPVANPSPQQVVPVEHAPGVPSAAGPRAFAADPAMTPAQARWKAEFDQLTREDVWRNPDVVITKNADGTFSTKPRTDGGQQQNGAPQPEGRQQPGPASADGNKTLRVGDIELSEADVRGLMERRLQEESRRATMPKDAASYALDLPADFELPPGTEWSWDTGHPLNAALFDQAKQFAWAHGLDQAAFSQMLALHAANQVSEAAHLAEARRAEIEKLCANAAVRIDSVGTFLEAQLGSELAGFIKQVMFTANAVKAIERLMRNFISQGVSGTPSAARDGTPRGPQRVSEAEYNAMSYHQRLEYAAQFQQK